MTVPDEDTRQSFFRFSLGRLGCFIAVLCFFLATTSFWLWPWQTTVRLHLPASEVPLKLPEGAADVSYAIHPSGEFCLEFNVEEPELIAWIESGIGPTIDEDKTPYIEEIKRPRHVGRFWGLTSFPGGETSTTLYEGFDYLYSTPEEGTIVVTFDRSNGRAYCKLIPPNHY